MISFFYGSNFFRLRQALNETRQTFLKKYPHAIGESFFLSLEDRPALETLKERLRADTLWSQPFLVSVRGSFPSVLAEELKKTIVSVSLQNTADRHLVFLETEDEIALKKKNSSWFSFLKESAKVKAFPPLPGVLLENWVKNEFAAHHLSVSSSLVKKLLSAVSNPDRLGQEIEKIAAYKSFFSKKVSLPVSSEDLDLLIKPDQTAHNFALAEAVANKNFPKALEEIQRRERAGEDPYAILGLLIYQFRLLLRLKSLASAAVPFYRLAAITKLHPFVVKKGYEQAKKFSLSELKQIFKRLADLDEGFKNGRTDLSSALVSTVAEITI